MQVVIRFAYPDDASAIARLAALDEAPVPPAPLLLGEVGGELWAALSPGTNAHISDPFRPAADIVALLRQRARQLDQIREGAHGRSRGVLRARRRSSAAVRLATSDRAPRRHRGPQRGGGAAIPRPHGDYDS
jgi:hypothetical protein